MRVLIYKTIGIGRLFTTIPFENEDEVRNFLLWSGVHLEKNDALLLGCWFCSKTFIFKVERNIL